MKFLIMIALLIPVMSSASVVKLPPTRNWTSIDYNRIYCGHRDAFYNNAKDRGIIVDPTNVGVEMWIRDDFKFWVKFFRINVTTPINQSDFICP